VFYIQGMNSVGKRSVYHIVALLKFPFGTGNESEPCATVVAQQASGTRRGAVLVAVWHVMYIWPIK